MNEVKLGSEEVQTPGTTFEPPTPIDELVDPWKACNILMQGDPLEWRSGVDEATGWEEWSEFVPELWTVEQFLRQALREKKAIKPVEGGIYWCEVHGVLQVLQFTEGCFIMMGEEGAIGLETVKIIREIEALRG